MNYAQTEGRASLEEMTTKRLKQLLIDLMKEKDGLHYTRGWLQSSYFDPKDEEIERGVAIKQLKQYGF
jgi:hypothetical protein